MPNQVHFVNHGEERELVNINAQHEPPIETLIANYHNFN